VTSCNSYGLGNQLLQDGGKARIRRRPRILFQQEPDDLTMVTLTQKIRDRVRWHELSSAERIAL
jgi:hypothetical protein